MTSMSMGTPIDGVVGGGFGMTGGGEVRDQCQPAVRKAWWQSGFGCLIRDLIEISPPVSRDPYNLRWRPGLGSCSNSRPPSDFLGGRKSLSNH